MECYSLKYDSTKYGQRTFSVFVLTVSVAAVSAV